MANGSLDLSWNSSDFSNSSMPIQMEMETPLLKKIHDIVIFVLLIAVMLSMGCVITPKQIWEHLRLPVGVGIGLLSQFLVLPLTAFTLIKALQIPTLQATGVLILATSPGGVTSNVFTYMVDGNVALSISMTILSTLLAMGMMPLNLWMYAGHLAASNGGFVVPYGKIGISLIVVTTPVVFGMLIKWKAAKFALVFSKVGAYIGLLLIALIFAMELALYPDIFEIITWKLYVALVLLPVTSLFLAYGLAWLCRQPTPIRKTVAIECSVQNVGLSITIITLSFPFHLQKSIIPYSYLFPIPSLTTMAVCIVIYKLWKRQRSKKNEEDAGFKGDKPCITEEYLPAKNQEADGQEEMLKTPPA